MRPFQFGVQYCFLKSRKELREAVRRADDQGYAAFLTPDHFEGIDLAVGPVLAAVAQLSDRLQVGSLVYGNDFRHPLLLAREMATLDLLSDGRALCGIGAGWYQGEYDKVGLAWDSPAKRVARLEEAVPLIKQAWSGRTFSHSGEFYQVKDYAGIPQPVAPRLMIGGGGRRVLSLAGREAQTVNLVTQLDLGFGTDSRKFTEDELQQKVDWVRQAAGARFTEIELSVTVFYGGVSHSPEEKLASVLDQQGYTLEQAQSSPSYLFGTRQQVLERLRYLRQQYGISSFYLSQMGVDLESMAPIVGELAGQ